MTRIRENASGRMNRPDGKRDLHSRPGVTVLDAWRTSVDRDARLTRLAMRGDMTGLPYDMPVE